jgi:GT2 family glycosyltransferase
MSLMELGWGDRIPRAKAETGFAAIDFLWARGFPRVDALRNWAARQALAAGYSHLLYLDADNVWPTDVLARLLRHADRDIVGGLYVMRGEPYAPVALVRGHRQPDSDITAYEYDHEAIWAQALREVEVLGMGCTLIQTQWFARLPGPHWFAYRDDAEGWPAVTEDVPFCEAARAAGARIWLDPTIVCGHVTQVLTDVRWHQRWLQAQRTPPPVPTRVTWREQVDPSAADPAPAAHG